MSLVAGFAVADEVSKRALQTERSGQWAKGKSCDGFGQLGPWLVNPDEVPDPQDLAVRLTVNDKSMQDGSLRKMVYQVPFLIHYLSQFITLHPGDVISTGTPPGVGMKQQDRYQQERGQHRRHQRHQPNAEALWLSGPDRDGADLNNLVEQDHRFIKRRVRPMLGFKSFRSAASTITEIELVHILRKGRFRPELRPFQQFCQLAA